MKFLVLALCVCAANAATFGGFQTFDKTQAAKSVQAPYAAAQAVVDVPVVVAKSIYDTGKVAYNTGKANSEASAAVVRSDSEISPDGFQYVYETENGIGAQASGGLKKVDNTEVFAIQGSYKYDAPDGTVVQVTYIADENGYQPQSDRLPVGPAIPEYIIRSLEYIRTHPQKVEQY